MIKVITFIRYAFEALLVGALFLVFRLLPLDAASAIGGFVGRSVGPKLAASRKAQRHIRNVFPDKPDGEVNAIITGMWDNLGRVMAEYPHLKTIATQRLTVKGEEYVSDTLKQAKGAVFYCLHMGNWEVPPAYMAHEFGADIHLMYRAPNNPWVDKMIHYWRTTGGALLTAHSKSRAGGQGAMKAIRSGAALAILIDQKYNEGINVPFFGMDAMTNPFFVKMARKFDVPLIPATICRTQGANFELTVRPPMDIVDRSDEEIVTAAHNILEEAIIRTPEQWLWLHRRWRG